MVTAKTMKARVITPIFKEIKDGEAKVLGLFQMLTIVQELMRQ